MSEPLFGKPYGEAGAGGRIDAEEPARPCGDEMGDECLGIIEVGGDHGTDDLATAEGTQRGEPGDAAVAAKDGELAHLGEIGNQRSTVGAEGKAVEFGDRFDIGGARSLRFGRCGDFSDYA